MTTKKTQAEMAAELILGSHRCGPCRLETYELSDKLVIFITCSDGSEIRFNGDVRHFKARNNHGQY